MSKNAVLRELLASPDTLVMPDAYDPLSARIIESLGFKAVQCSGYSFALAACCSSEAAFGFERNLALTRSIVEAVWVSVMAEVEYGFGVVDGDRQLLSQAVGSQSVDDAEVDALADCVALVRRDVVFGDDQAHLKCAGACPFRRRLTDVRLGPDSAQFQAWSHGNLRHFKPA